MSFNNWVATLPELQSEGLIVQENVYDDHSVKFLWFGTSPLMDQISAEGARRGLAVSFVAAPYSRSQCESAAQDIFASSEELKTTRAFELSSVSLENFDFPGLTVTGRFNGQSVSDPTAEAELAQHLSSATGLTVRVQYGWAVPA